jgi:hypothetical protein
MGSVIETARHTHSDRNEIENKAIFQYLTSNTNYQIQTLNPHTSVKNLAIPYEPLAWHVHSNKDSN